MKTVEVWKAKSFWEEQHADGSKTYWHLHPELVEEDVKKKGHSTLLCSRCAESIKKNKKSPNSLLQTISILAGHRDLGSHLQTSQSSSFWRRRGFTIPASKFVPTKVARLKIMIFGQWLAFMPSCFHTMPQMLLVGD